MGWGCRGVGSKSGALPCPVLGEPPRVQEEELSSPTASLVLDEMESENRGQSHGCYVSVKVLADQTSFVPGKQPSSSGCSALSLFLRCSRSTV